MFNRKSDYALNKKNMASIVYRVHSVTKKALKSLHFPTKYAIITARE